MIEDYEPEEVSDVRQPITARMIDEGVRAWMSWNERADYAPERLVAEVYQAMSRASQGPESRFEETSR